MRIVFVLTYPTHYAMPDLAEWLRWDNRDRRTPALLKTMGVDVELWGVRDRPLDTWLALPDLPELRVRLFEASNSDAPPRAQVSETMAAAARADPADLFVLIGSDGSAGLHLHDAVLKPDSRRYAVIIGGTWWSRILPGAALVMTESAAQEIRLARPGWQVWRRAIPADRQFRMPKTINTDRFTPIAANKDWDLIAASRLMPYKSFVEIGALSNDYRVAVAGDGRLRARLERRYPRIDWLGHVSHGELPATFARARLFFHAGRRDWFPRAIPEAMACGLPAVVFADRIGPDVVPPSAGLLVNDCNYREEVAQLLASPDTLAAKGQAARAHVLANHGLRSTEAACRKLIEVAR